MPRRRAETIPESHAKLLDERAALADAGKMARIPGKQVREELMRLAMSNLRRGSPQIARVLGRR